MRIATFVKLLLLIAFILVGCKGQTKVDDGDDIANLPKEEQLIEYNKQTMRNLPLQVDSGVVMQKVWVEDSIEVYLYTIDQNIVERKLVEQNVEYLQAHPEDLLDMADNHVATMVALLYELRMGLEYRYLFSEDKDSISIVYPRKTLRNLYAVDLLRQAAQ